VKKYDRESFLDLMADSPTPLPVMLEDRRMGMCNHVTDTHVLVDVYSGNDHDAQLHIPFSNFLDVPLLGLVAGLEGVDRSEDAKAPKATGFPSEFQEAVAAVRRGEAD
jgi:hypothetical protein